LKSANKYRSPKIEVGEKWDVLFDFEVNLIKMSVNKEIMHG
tara:strand:+ start:152 stop:274 length:123 start_codon:yes stop_codon:yes gene_type:complete